MTRAAVVALALALSAGPAAAAPPPVTPVYAGYWSSFVDHWTDFFRKQNGIVMTALGVGAVALFIITRGKWVK